MDMTKAIKAEYNSVLYTIVCCKKTCAVRITADMAILENSAACLPEIQKSGCWLKNQLESKDLSHQTVKEQQCRHMVDTVFGLMFYDFCLIIR